MTVDILIPMYNSKKTIVECIQSVLAQTYKNVNIIICDDASVDGCYDFVQNIFGHIDRLKLYRNENNLGYLKTFNKLLTYSTSKFIAFLDADDTIEPLKIEKQVDILMSNPGLGAVGCNFRRFCKGNDFTGPSNLPFMKENIISALLLGQDAVCGSSIMVKREVIDNVGGYRDFFNGYVGEDIDWVSRIIQRYDFRNIDYCGYNYRIENTSLTRKVRYEIRAIHIHDFIRFLFAKRIEEKTWVDIVDENNYVEIDRFFNKFELLYASNPGALYSKTAIEHAINGDFKKSICDLKKCIENKFNTSNLLRVVVVIAILRVFPLSFLLRLKELFNLKNISKSIIK